MRRFQVAFILSICIFFLSFIVQQSQLVNHKDEIAITLDSTVVQTKVVASGLNVAWEISWGPDNWIWFTEQSGTISKVDPNTGTKKILLKIQDVYRKRSLGLLGMAIHPDKNTPFVFVDYTYQEGEVLLSKLVRYTYTADTLLNPVVLLKDIPGSTGHNGSRVVISPDGKVMMSTGYGSKKTESQNLGTLNGKILRLNTDGTIPEDNPFPGSPIYSWGHRNPQGLVFNPNGMLYSSEHGDAIEDELNIIKKGGNYGWPYIEGFNNTKEESVFFKNNAIVVPLKSWTPVIAPAGIDYYNSDNIPEWKNSLLMVTLKTQTFRVLQLNNKGDTINSEKVYFKNEFGRLRDICISPQGDVYMATSNRDWNPSEGYPKSDDDRIIKIFKVKTIRKATLGVKTPKKVISNSAVNKPVANIDGGAKIYSNYCASCHKKDGTGIPGTFPPLKATMQVVGDKTTLLNILLKGLTGPIIIHGTNYDQEMPSFRFLTDKEISEVSTYIRTSFGNKASAVSVNDVTKVRSGL